MYTDITTEYLENLIDDNFEGEYLKGVRAYAEKHGVPIMRKQVANFIYTLVKLVKPKKILEVGMAIGYSASIMKRAYSETKISTMEIEESSICEATKHFKAQGIESDITIFKGDAKDIVPNVSGNFDFIFLDGPKSYYIKFLPYLIDVLNKGGVLVADNVLFRDYIAGEKKFPKDKCTIVKNLREFLIEISNRKDLSTTILPFGDGVSISIKE